MTKKRAVLFLLLICLGFFLLLTHDINSWYYSAIGDEYALYDFARDIATGTTKISFLPTLRNTSIFLQNGIYSHIPIASSYYQAIIMAIFGINHAGFVLSSVLVVILSFWFFYYYVKDQVGAKIAMASVCILASSHYLWGLIHTGYWNNQVLFPHLAAFFFYFRGLKKKSAFYFFLAGIFSGLGFYTYYSSRITIILLSAYFLLNAKAFLRQKNLFFFFYLGFLILFLPFLIVNKETTIQQMLNLSLVHSDFIEPGQRFLFFFKNLWSSFVAFYSNSQTHHFVSGSLIDPLTAVLFSIGLLLMIFNWRKYYFVLLWFLAKIVVLGGFSRYTDVPLTRLYFLLPVISFISAYGLINSVTILKGRFSLGKTGIATSIVLLAISILNINRFYRQTPHHMQLTNEAVAIGAWIEGCKQSKTLIIDKYYEPVLKPAIDSYKFTNPPTLIKDEEFKNDMIEQFDCFILGKADNERAKKIIETFKERGLTVKTFWDFSKLTKVVLIEKINQ